ncbi:MAG: efflux RND transporter permease subunit, partial [Pseudomonadota bacterium]
RSFANGRPNITLGIRRDIGANVSDVMDGVVAKVEELNASLLKREGLQMELTSEDVQYVKDAVSGVRQNLLIGAVLATAVLYLFLRSVPATLIGACGIPVCTIAAFLGLLATGRTINVISLAGIAFAIGMTLDNGIVVLENIHRHRAMGKKRLEAAYDGVRGVWTAVLASTLTTVFVFLPIIYITDEAGQLYSDIAIAISASILMSMAVAVTAVPAAANRYLPPIQTEVSGGWLFEAGRACGRWTMGAVEWLLRGVWRRVGFLIAVLAATALIILGLTPKAEYLPEGEESKTFSFMFAPPGYNLQEMTKLLDGIHKTFLPHLNEDPDRFARGESDIPGLHFVVTYVRPQAILMIAETRAPDQIDDLIKVISKEFAQAPGMISFSSRGSIFASNLGGARSINLDITGPELASLFETGLVAFRRSKEIFDNPQVRPDPPALTLGQPLLEIRPDWERASEMGLDARDIGYAVWAFTDGAYIDEFFLGDDKIDMFLYSDGGLVQRPEDIPYIHVYTRDGGMTTLGALAKVVETVNTEVIRRVDGTRTVTLSIIPPRDVPLETAIEKVQTEIVDALSAEGPAGKGVNLRISGASDRLKATRDALTANFLVALLISYLLMVAIFSHWAYPLVIMASVPLGISGGIAGLWLLNAVGGNLELFGMHNIRQPFDMITMLGFLILIGTVVNNPILLVEQALMNVRSHGMDSVAAVVESTRTRLRPIVMSSITTVLGLSPLVFIPGAGAELYRGLGAIVLFGILFSTVITLFFIPSLLSLIFQIGASFRRQSGHG